MQNKKIDKTYFEVVYKPTDYLGLTAIFGAGSRSFASPPISLNTTIIQTPEEFANTIWDNKNGTMGLIGGTLVSFTKKTKSHQYPPILLTETVYKQYKNLNPTRNSITKNFWSLQTEPIKDINQPVYGADLHWVV